MYKLGGDKEAVNVSLLMPLVHKADLSRTEIQVLIDVLLNKQQGSSVDSTEWIEVSDNLLTHHGLNNTSVASHALQTSS